MLQRGLVGAGEKTRQSGPGGQADVQGQLFHGCSLLTQGQAQGWITGDSMGVKVKTKQEVRVNGRCAVHNP
jgi:hypothetical protein